MNVRRWFSAEVHRSDRRQVALRRAGDGRADSDPFADPGCLYIISADDARALAAELVAAADAVSRPAGCR